MNLCEAVAFGPRFKIKRSNYNWISINVSSDNFEWIVDGRELSFYPTPSDLIANDWIVEEINDKT